MTERVHAVEVDDSTTPFLLWMNTSGWQVMFLTGYSVQPRGNANYGTFTTADGVLVTTRRLDTVLLPKASLAMTLTLTSDVNTQRESLSRIRHTLQLVEVQAREGKIRWEDDGVIRVGHLYRGVRDLWGRVIGGADPRGHHVLLTTLGVGAEDVVVHFDHLVDLADAGKVQVLR